MVESELLSPDEVEALILDPNLDSLVAHLTDKEIIALIEAFRDHSMAAPPELHKRMAALCFANGGIENDEPLVIIEEDRVRQIERAIARSLLASLFVGSQRSGDRKASEIVLRMLGDDQTNEDDVLELELTLGKGPRMYSGQYENETTIPTSDMWINKA